MALAMDKIHGRGSSNEIPCGGKLWRWENLANL